MDDLCAVLVDDFTWLRWLGDVLYEILPQIPNWSDVIGIITAGSTLGLFVAAWAQLHRISDNQRRWTTLQACDRYDTDPILTTQRRMLRARLRNPRAVEDPDVQFAINTLLNYFDAIAIGINQKLYMRDIVDAHLGSVIDIWLNRLGNTLDTVVNKELTNVGKYYPDLVSYYKGLLARKNREAECPSFLANP